MLHCASCGNDEPDPADSCSHCGATLATVILLEDTAVVSPNVIASATSSRPRLHVISSPDEGRFVSGTLVAGRYRIIGLLGRGGMGEVYRATDLALAQSVALKFLPKEAADNERLLERFHSEVRIARQVSHPNVCRVYDIGEAEGLPFISMEYVDGEDLADLLQRIGRLPSAKALEIARKLCAGLAAAHERGVIHRDLKPHNIMLNKRGEVVIMDFGLAAAAREVQGPEARNGTPAYMAPEQLRGESVTASSDLYALGLILYELFTGKRAFEAPSLADLIRLQDTSRPPSMTSIAADVDPSIERVIFQCLQPHPTTRPASALAIAAALPGGDPLAAALAAGETPSPELVAASGKTEGFPIRYAIPCLVFVLLGLILYPFALRKSSVLALAPLDFSPVVLEQKAREIAAGLGYNQKPADWKSWFNFNQALVDSLKNMTGTKNWAKLFAVESPMYFRYRESPGYLTSSNGEVTLERPDPHQPGMLTIFMDSRGFLRRFQAIPPRFDTTPQAETPCDPASLFKLAGLDLANFRQVSPTFAPPTAFESRQAWSGPHPGLPQTNLTVEIATWHGKVTSFNILWPWDKPASSAAEGPAWTVLGTFTVVLYASFLFCIVYYARHNLRLNRGDQKGALRFATLGFSIAVVSWLAGLHIVPDPGGMMNTALENVGVALAFAVVIWLLYVALEPAVRARWPHSLITWNRLLAGQFGDPLLGSHVLFGCVMGVALIFLFFLQQHWSAVAGAPSEPHGLETLFGTRAIIAMVGNLLFSALLSGPASFFLLCGIRVLVRRDWLAALVGALVLSLQEGNLRHSSHMALDLPFYVALFAALAFALLRMGLVPAILATFIANLIDKVPVSSSFSAWYNPEAVFLLLTCASIAVFGFWRSQSDPAGAR
jgi:serine/threonine protein kinase